LREDIHKIKSARPETLLKERHRSNFQMVEISMDAALKWGCQSRDGAGQIDPSLKRTRKSRVPAVKFSQIIKIIYLYSS